MQGHDPLLDSIKRVQHAADAITHRHQLTAWVQGQLRDLIPHQKAILGFGQVGYSTVQIDLAYNIDLTGEYFTQMHPSAGNLGSPVLARWLERRTPQIFLPTSFGPFPQHRWLNTLARHQIDNGIFDASVEHATGRMCFIKLLNVTGTLEFRANVLTQCVTPLLKHIWQRVDTHSRTESTSQLERIDPSFSVAELKVLRFLREGKTNHEIGLILCRSESTIKRHVENMLHKSGAATRHQLVSMHIEI